MADKPVPAEQLQNEYDEIITTVCSKRKAYPAACASILSKTLKLENSLVMNPNIALRVDPKPEVDCRQSDADNIRTKTFKELIAGMKECEPAEFKLNMAMLVDSAVKKHDEVRVVLKQIQSTSEDKVAKHLN